MINAGKSLIMVLLFDKNDYFSGTILSFVMVLVFVVDCNHFSNSIQKNVILFVQCPYIDSEEGLKKGTC